MPKPNSICVYCGSSDQGPDSHRQAAQDLGETLARNKIRLVYGGGQIGLMGATADAALANGGEVIGIIPQFLKDLEVGHAGCTELIVTDTMHERKRKMVELSDAFAILPGGLGTLDETFEILTWRQLRLHDKPIILVNIDDYWSPLLALIENQINENYVRAEHRRLYEVVDRVEDILPAITRSPVSEELVMSDRL
ncbi:MAG: TIGR00730 family Rossman fold protein [Alphaproteobacteria bacterium]|nr:TIGR00730 family Rossman fold protein [Alphaproteobacteria bacterium]